jgi:hypothetical protein
VCFWSVPGERLNERAKSREAVLGHEAEAGATASSPQIYGRAANSEVGRSEDGAAGKGKVKERERDIVLKRK